MAVLAVAYLGRTDYGECWRLQKEIHALRLASRTPDMLLLTEHNHVYTIGKTGNPDHLLADEGELKDRDIAVYFNDRGGDVTYHGPGQIVGYPILDLHAHYLDLHRYLRDIEEAIIRTLGRFGIRAGRAPDYTGVWVGTDKICAIGVKTSRWITMHGFALNVSTDLAYFGRIIPCGIFDRGVTSMKQILGREVRVSEVLPSLVRAFADVFQLNPRDANDDEMLAMARPERILSLAETCQPEELCLKQR